MPSALRRLQSLEDCNRIGMRFEGVGFPMLPCLRSLLVLPWLSSFPDALKVDREVDLAFSVTGNQDGLEVVESGPKVVNKIPDHHTDHRVRLFREAEAVDYTLILALDPFADLLRVAARVGPEGMFDLDEVLLGPLDLKVKGSLDHRLPLGDG